jgi:hypothetical protein
VTKVRIAQFRDTQATSGPAGSTANTELKIIKMLFRAARLGGLLWQDPAEGKPLNDARERAHRRAFTVLEIGSLLAIADDDWQSLTAAAIARFQQID